MEKTDIVYSPTMRCSIKGKPESFIIASEINNADSIADQLKIIIVKDLDNKNEIQNISKINLAYAYLKIAHKMGDIRAEEPLKILAKNIKEDELEELDKLIEKRYLLSYLRKCFYVPDEYLKPENSKYNLVNYERK